MSWKILKVLYFSFIDSELLYGVEIYGNSCGTVFSKLTMLNNKILRILQNKPYDTRTTDLYRTYCTLPILKLHEFRVLLLMHKFVHHKDKLPNAFNNYFVSTTLFICMILGIELTYIDTELIHHMAIAVWNIKELRCGIVMGRCRYLTSVSVFGIFVGIFSSRFSIRYRYFKISRYRFGISVFQLVHFKGHG